MSTPAALPTFDPISGKFASIARELALDINPLETILKHHQITPNDFERIKEQPAFKKYLEEALQLWNSSLSTAERVKIKQLFLVEQSLETMWGYLLDTKEPLSSRVELFKALQRGGGNVGGVTEAGNTGAGVKITINLGEDSKLKFEKSAPVIELEAEQ